MIFRFGRNIIIMPDELVLIFDIWNRYYNAYEGTIDKTKIKGYICASIYLAESWYKPEELDRLSFDELAYHYSACSKNTIKDMVYEIMVTLNGLIWMPGLEK